MCGIVGQFSFNNNHIATEEIQAMLSTISHRGPDGHGIWNKDFISLGHTRLSIIDLSELGAQPMHNHDSTIILVCNGEIYNYKALRHQLEAKGYQFRSHSDSEVLIHLYAEHKESPEKMLDEVQGMFSFAIYDLTKERLLLVRDRLGIKPLFYAVINEKLYFSSELTSIEAVIKNHLTIDWTSVYEYLQLLTIPGPNTIYKEIKCVAPATMLTVDKSGIQTHNYWKAPNDQESIINATQVEQELDELLQLITKDHLEADVPLGSFLSAGVDSSLISYYAAKAYSPQKITTFCATFPGEPEDEGQIAQQTALQIGSNHFSFEMKSGFLDQLEEVVKYMDQPMALTSAVSLYQISSLARQHVKVVLTGDGGDELFGGYDHRHIPFFVPKLFDRLPFFYQKNIGLIIKLFSNTSSKWYRIGHNLTLSVAEKYLDRVRILDKTLAKELIPKKYRNEIDENRYIKRLKFLFRESQNLSPLNSFLYVDIHTTLVDEMMFKADRMTMACALEARVPFLDHRLVEFSMKISPELKRDGHWGKLPLRKNLEGKLGHSLAYRAKTGFNSPLTKWLREDPQTRQKYNQIWECDSLFDPQVLKEVKNNFDNEKSQNSLLIFAILVMNTWLKNRTL